MGRLADGMQVERPGKALQFVVILAYRRTSLQPSGLGSRTPWALVDLNKVKHADPIVPWLAKALDYLRSHQVEKEHKVDHDHDPPLGLAKAEQVIASKTHATKDRTES
jgi:hypothetical protein